MEDSGSPAAGGGISIPGTVTDSTIISGSENVVANAVGSRALSTLTPAERSELQHLFATLRDTISANAPTELRREAISHVEQLERAVISESPDASRIQVIQSWFATHLPALAGAVMGVVVHPLVGAIVAAAGTRIAKDI